MLKQIFKQTILFSFLITNLHFVLTDTALARWAKPDDAALTCTSLRHIDVKQDGTAIESNDTTIQMLKEQAKAYLAQYPIQYNPEMTRIKIIEAKTIVNGQEYPVDLSKIQDKPVSSKMHAFDQKNQMIIPFPHLEIGATIHFKYENITTKSIPANTYMTAFVFKDNYYVTPNTITIRSELPLYTQANDPDHFFSIKHATSKKHNRSISYVEIKQLKPFIKGLINEEHNNLNPKHIPIISVSSLKHLNDYSQALAAHYVSIKKQPLPALYQEIAKVAQAQKTPTDKINTITSLLAEKITYLSNMQTIKGAIIPQSLEMVAHTRLGDCKDFSMATATILDSMGFTTKIALVQRGEHEMPWPNDLPGPGHFNHAILKVELPEKDLWVDPTNFVSMANHIFPDIAHKKASVLDTKKSSYETIPAIRAQDNRVVRNEVLDMRQANKLDLKGTLHLLGNSAYSLTGQRNNASEETLKNALIDNLSESYGQVLNHTMTLPNLHSRIVNDLTFDYTLTTQASNLQTNAGLAQPLTFKAVDKFIHKTETVSDIYLGAPFIIEKYCTLKNISVIGNHSLDCHIESPWVNISRTVKYGKEGVIVHQKIETKKSWIEGVDLESKAYKQLDFDIRQHFNNGTAIIFEPIKPADEPSRALS